MIKRIQAKSGCFNLGRAVHDGTRQLNGRSFMRRSTRTTAGKPPARFAAMSTLQQSTQQTKQIRRHLPVLVKHQLRMQHRMRRPNIGPKRNSTRIRRGKLWRQSQMQRAETAAQIDTLRQELSAQADAQAANNEQPPGERAAQPTQINTESVQQASQPAASPPIVPGNGMYYLLSGVTPEFMPITAMPTTRPTSELSGNIQHRHKVYDVPPFDGKPEDWLIFEAEYTQSTAEYGYTDAQNISRLC